MKLVSAGIKVRALLLARRAKESDLVDEPLLARHGMTRGSWLKFTSRLVHGKVHVSPDDPKLKVLAGALHVPLRLLASDAAWPGNGSRFGLTDDEARTMEWLRSLHEWYVDHAGPEAAHKYLGLDFDALRRQTQLLQALARGFGDDALIRVFVTSDYEEGRFDREFASIERAAERSPSLRAKIRAYVADVPAAERVPGRVFPALKLGELAIELSFVEELATGRVESRYVSRGTPTRRRLSVRARMPDEQLAYILAREVAIRGAVRLGVIASEPYVEHHWPSEVHHYAHRRSELLVNRFAAALLVSRKMLRSRERELLADFSHELLEGACRAFGVAPETLLLRIVQLNPRRAHFMRIDAAGPKGPFTLAKLFRGNGLPVHYRYRALNVLPKGWGVLKSLQKFFASDPRGAAASSRHVQVTRMTRCGNKTYVCMSLTYPRFGGGAKVLCIGFRKRDFEKTYGRLPALSESRVSVDDTSYDVEWSTLMRLEEESRARG